MLIEYSAHDLEFVLADNGLHDPYLDAWSREIVEQDREIPIHAYGYNGLRVLKHRTLDESIVKFAFLNLENVGDGSSPRSTYDYYEPRRNPVAVYRLSPSRGVLMQNPLPHWGLESNVRIEAFAPCYLDVTIGFETHRQPESGGPLLVLMPNYVNAPEDPRTHFVAEDGRWTVSESDANASTTYPCSRHQKEILSRCERMILGSLHESVLGKPLYYGRWRHLVFAHFFDSGESISFVVNPRGAGKGNPAWDVQLCLEDPEPNKRYVYSSRMLLKPFVSENDILQEYAHWLEGRR